MKNKLVLGLGLLTALGVSAISCSKNKVNSSDSAASRANSSLLAEAAVRAIDLGNTTSVPYSTPFIFTTRNYDPILGSAMLDIPSMQDGTKVLADGVYTVEYTMQVAAGGVKPDFSPAYKKTKEVNFSAAQGILSLDGLRSSDLMDMEYDIKIFFRLINTNSINPSDFTVFRKQTYVMQIAKKAEFTNPSVTGTFGDCADIAYTPTWTASPALGETAQITFVPNTNVALIDNAISVGSVYTIYSMLTTKDSLPTAYKVPAFNVKMDSNGELLDAVTNDPFVLPVDVSSLDDYTEYIYHAYLLQKDATPGTNDVLSVCTTLEIIPSEW